LFTSALVRAGVCRRR